MNSPSPSPLVPQGAIPPKNTSRSARVLLIGFTVVLLHVAGLGVVLMQGCQKDGAKSAAGAETNAPAMTYPAADTNPPAPMFATATNPPAVVSAPTTLPVTSAATNPYPGAAAIASNPPPVPADAGLNAPAPVGDQPAPAGPTSDYKVQKGDLPTTIAAKHHISVSALMKANPSVDPRKMKVGQTLKIPAAAPATTAPSVAGTASVPPTAVATASSGASGTYKVKSGDTLTKIAKAHGITVNQLRAANNLKTTQVQAGKTLKIPAKTQRTAAAPVDTNSAAHQ